MSESVRETHRVPGGSVYLGTGPRPRVWVRKRLFWWSAINPDEVLATVDTNTTLRALTRKGVIEKWRRRLAPADPPDEVRL